MDIPQPDANVEDDESDDECTLICDDKPQNCRTDFNAYHEDELLQAVHLSTKRQPTGVYLAENEGLSNICAHRNERRNSVIH